MTKCLAGPFETRNTSAGCSAVMIQVGSCRGFAKWLPINARDSLGVTSRCRGNWQEKSLA
eukprot:3369623-Amphidinium_carterae.1